MAGMDSPSQKALELSREQVILIATRLVVVYLLFWVAFDLTLLPHELLSVAHYVNESKSGASVSGASYFLRGYILDLLANTLHIALWLMAAGWFYRCGPRIRNFFTGGDE